MWRRARGRLAIVVGLGGALLARAPTPALAHKVIHPETPEERVVRLSRAIEEDAHGSCTSGAVLGNRYGEVRVSVRRRPENDGSGPVVETETRASLVEADRLCVEAAARRHVPSEARSNDAFVNDFTVWVALGRPPPLFEPAQVTQWFGAGRSKAARERFVARLPAEVDLENDNKCLSVPNRPFFTKGIESAIATAGTPLSEYWQPDNDPAPARHQGEVVAGLTGHGTPKTRAYLVGGGEGLLLHHRTAADAPEQWVCLLPLDQTLRQELRARLDRRGSCWVGKLRDTLLEPRTEFQAIRPLKAIAIGPTRTCGLDDSGAPICCGERADADPPPGPYAGLAVGSDFDCGINPEGGLVCWGYWAPARGAPIPGPYAEVGVAEHEACAIRRDTRALDCWRRDQSRMATVMRDRVRSFAFQRDHVCAQIEDGRTFCRSLAADARWSAIPGAFRVFAANFGIICGATGPQGRDLRCWEDHWDGWRPAPEPDRPTMPTPVDEPTSIAMSAGDGCALGSSGQIKCWRSPVRGAWGGVYRSLTGTTTRLCALTAEGRVECDREWPFLKP
jgi:hypothetical protein